MITKADISNLWCGDWHKSGGYQTLACDLKKLAERLLKERDAYRRVAMMNMYDNSDEQYFAKGSVAAVYVDAEAARIMAEGEGKEDPDYRPCPACGCRHGNSTQPCPDWTKGREGMSKCLYPDWEGGMTASKHQFDKNGCCVVCGEILRRESVENKG